LGKGIKNFLHKNVGIYSHENVLSAKKEIIVKGASDLVPKKSKSLQLFSRVEKV
jgi:hypothetical protein